MLVMAKRIRSAVAAGSGQQTDDVGLSSNKFSDNSSTLLSLESNGIQAHSLVDFRSLGRSWQQQYLVLGKGRLRRFESKEFFFSKRPALGSICADHSLHMEDGGERDGRAILIISGVSSEYKTQESSIRGKTTKKERRESWVLGMSRELWAGWVEALEIVMRQPHQESEEGSAATLAASHEDNWEIGENMKNAINKWAAEAIRWRDTMLEEKKKKEQLLNSKYKVEKQLHDLYVAESESNMLSTRLADVLSSRRARAASLRVQQENLNAHHSSLDLRLSEASDLQFTAVEVTASTTQNTDFRNIFPSEADTVSSSTLIEGNGAKVLSSKNHFAVFEDASLGEDLEWTTEDGAESKKLNLWLKKMKSYLKQQATLISDNSRIESRLTAESVYRRTLENLQHVEVANSIQNRDRTLHRMECREENLKVLQHKTSKILQEAIKTEGMLSAAYTHKSTMLLSVIRHTQNANSGESLRGFERRIAEYAAAIGLVDRRMVDAVKQSSERGSSMRNHSTSTGKYLSSAQRHTHAILKQRSRVQCAGRQALCMMRVLCLAATKVDPLATPLAKTDFGANRTDIKRDITRQFFSVDDGAQEHRSQDAISFEAGIGLVLRDSEGWSWFRMDLPLTSSFLRFPVIASVTPSSPSAAATALASDPNFGGLSPGHVIESVDGVSTAGRSAAQVEWLLSGRPGTAVTLLVGREKDGQVSRESMTIYRPSTTSSEQIRWPRVASWLRRTTHWHLSVAEQHANAARLEGQITACNLEIASMQRQIKLALFNAWNQSVKNSALILQIDQNLSTAAVRRQPFDPFIIRESCDGDLATSLASTSQVVGGSGVLRKVVALLHPDSMRPLAEAEIGHGRSPLLSDAFHGGLQHGLQRLSSLFDIFQQPAKNPVP